MYLKRLFARLQAPAGDGGSTVDRGDSFTPNDEPYKNTGGGDPAAEILAQAEKDAENKGAAGADEPGDKGAKAAGAEGGGEGGGADETAGKEGKPEQRKGIIPRERHESILAKERERREAAEAQLEQLRAGQKKVQSSERVTTIDTKIEELEAKHAKYITDGETEKAQQAMRDMRQLERERATIESDERTSNAIAQATEAARYDVAMERILEVYPELDPDHESFDEVKTHTVVLLTRGLQLEGMTPTKALQAAVKRTMGADTSRQAAAITVQPRVDKQEAEQEAKKDLAAERKAGALDKALATAAKQPASTANVGKESAGGETKSVLGMDQDEFRKLSKDDRAKLRGDVLA